MIYQEQLLALHGGDHRHKDAPGMSWKDIREALEGRAGMRIPERTFFSWLSGSRTPHPLVVREIDALYRGTELAPQPDAKTKPSREPS